MTLKSLGPNCHELTFGTAHILFSYATPVGVWRDGFQPIVATKISTTTSRHVNGWLGGEKPARIVSTEELEQYIHAAMKAVSI